MPPWAVCTITGIVQAGLAHTGEHAEAVEIGHHEVEDDAIDSRLVGAEQRRHGRIPALGDHGLVAEAAGHVLDQAALHRIVIDDQYDFRHGLAVLRRACHFGSLSPIALNAG